MRAAIGAGIAPLERVLDGVRWTAPEALHVTLKFLGNVTTAAVDEMIAALDHAAAAHAPFGMVIGGLGAFPGARRPQVLWLGVEDGGALRAIAGDVDAALASLGFAPEARAFTPHVTVGRVRRPRGAARAQGRADLPPCNAGASLHVETIDLMRSHLGRDGARHECLHRSRLGGERE